MASTTKKATFASDNNTNDNAMRTALFAGSFDPFTTGHASVVRRILPLFDRLVIGIGYNKAKEHTSPAAKRVEAISRLYAADKRIEVTAYSCLTVDMARQIGAQYIVKGIRNYADFEREREQADINRHIAGVETIFIAAEPGLESVSSSMVRELAMFGHDVTEFLPSTETSNEHTTL